MSKKETIYNIYIVDEQDNAIALLGKNIREGRRPNRMQVILNKLGDSYFMADEEVGNDNDIRYNQELNNK